MYKVDLKNVKRGRYFYLVFLLAGLFFLSIFIFAMPKNESIIFIFMFIPIIFILVAIVAIKNINKKIKDIKYLEKYGTLIKGMEYKMVASNVSINNRRVLAIEVEYVDSNGNKTILVGQPRYDYKLSDADGLVDLLIDENDISKYYIDFNIKEDFQDFNDNNKSVMEKEKLYDDNNNGPIHRN